MNPKFTNEAELEKVHFTKVEMKSIEKTLAMISLLAKLEVPNAMEAMSNLRSIVKRIDGQNVLRFGVEGQADQESVETRSAEEMEVAEKKDCGSEVSTDLFHNVEGDREEARAKGGAGEQTGVEFETAGPPEFAAEEIQGNEFDKPQTGGIK